MTITTDVDGKFTVTGSYAGGTVDSISADSITTSELPAADWQDRKIRVAFFDSGDNLIEHEFFTIVSVLGNELTLNPAVQTVNYATAFYNVFYTMDDLDSSANETSHIEVARGVYTVTRNINIEGYLGNSYDIMLGAI